MIGLVVSIVIIMGVMTFYPSIEGLIEDIGSEMATSANYSVDSTDADNVKDTIWGLSAGLLVLGLMVYLYQGSKGY